MKIAIDVSQIIYGTGVSVYTRNLVENLLKLDKESEYILFGGSLRRRSELLSILDDFNGEKLKREVFPIPQTLADYIWNKAHIFPVEKLTGRIDVFHSSDWTQPPSMAFKVIPEAVDPRCKPAKKRDIERTKRKYRISGKYLLSVGVNARKNTGRIIKAYEKIKGETNMKLIIVGKPFIYLNEPRGVRFLGHVTPDTLPSLYSGADALVYPSLYEGFGLPILEAYVCKLPVVTSNFGSMAEVAGKAAVFVDPYDTYSIAEGVLKAISGKEGFIKKGLAHVKNFSWQKTAKMTLRVYMESLN